MVVRPSARRRLPLSTIVVPRADEETLSEPSASNLAVMPAVVVKLVPEAERCAASDIGVRPRTLCGAAGFTEMYMMDFKREAILMCHQGEGNWRLCRADRRPYLKNRVLSEGGLSNPPTPIFTPEPGRACILSLTHLTADRFRLVCAPGEILPDADLLHVDMPYLFFRPDSGVRSCMTAWLEQGGTHHEALVLGDRLDRIRLFCRLWNVEFVQL